MSVEWVTILIHVNLKPSIRAWELVYLAACRGYGTRSQNTRTGGHSVSSWNVNMLSRVSRPCPCLWAYNSPVSHVYVTPLLGSSVVWNLFLYFAVHKSLSNKFLSHPIVLPPPFSYHWCLIIVFSSIHSCPQHFLYGFFNVISINRLVAMPGMMN